MRNCSPLRIVVVDDHPIIRLALAGMIKARQELELCTEAANAADAIQAIREFEPDIAVVDIRLKDGSGFDVMRAEYDNRPKFLAFSAHKDPIVVRQAFNAGASGYVTKSALTTDVLAGIQALAADESFLGSEISLELGAATDQNSIVMLTNREIEVYELIGQGLGTSEIANRLIISVKTIETHKENLKIKLELSSGNELLRHAMQWSLGYGNKSPD